MPQERPQAPARPCRVVLDTNVMLDTLVFGELACAPWHAALREHRLRAVVDLATWAEWVQVIGRKLPARWEASRERALTSGPDFDVERWDAAVPAAPQGLQVSDPDDQKFMDLGLACGARWLLTRDKALLRLARPAARHGLQVLRPADAAPG